MPCLPFSMARHFTTSSLVSYLRSGNARMVNGSALRGAGLRERKRPAITSRAVALRSPSRQRDDTRPNRLHRSPIGRDFSTRAPTHSVTRSSANLLLVAVVPYTAIASSTSPQDCSPRRTGPDGCPRPSVRSPRLSEGTCRRYDPPPLSTAAVPHLVVPDAASNRLLNLRRRGSERACGVGLAEHRHELGGLGRAHDALPAFPLAIGSALAPRGIPTFELGFVRCSPGSSTGICLRAVTMRAPAALALHFASFASHS